MQTRGFLETRSITYLGQPRCYPPCDIPITYSSYLFNIKDNIDKLMIIMKDRLINQTDKNITQ